MEHEHNRIPRRGRPLTQEEQYWEDWYLGTLEFGDMSELAGIEEHLFEYDDIDIELLQKLAQ